MDQTVSRIVFWGALAGQYALGFVFFAACLRAVFERRPRWAHLAALRWGESGLPDKWLAFARIRRTDPGFKERERLLAGCGYTGDPALYILIRKAFLAAFPIWAAAVYGIGLLRLRLLPDYALPLAFIAAMMLALWDTAWLEAMRKTRSERMTKEIYVVSSQLLYLAGSSLHIHTKLMRCLPYTRTMRSDMQTMLGEWYHDAEGALRRFKLRLGTEDGLSFVETIDSLRLHESEEYYVLLRERIQDYKEKLELAKESRKESTSYVLFVLAGIPILYTFQIFIYPWVREGQKLFESLN